MSNLWDLSHIQPKSGSVLDGDTIPAMFGVVRVTSSRGTVSVTGNSFSVNIGVMQPGEEVTISVETVANVLAVPPQTCNTAFVGSIASNEVCVNIFPAELAAFGGDSPLTTTLRSLWWLWSVVGIALTLGGWLLLRRSQLPPYLVHHVLRMVIRRARELDLVVVGSLRVTQRELFALLERIVFDFVRRGRERYTL